MPSRPIRSVIQNQRVICVSATTSVRNAATLMKEHRMGAIMVVESELLVGIFTARDALFRVVAAGLDPDRTSVETVMSHNPTSTTPDHPVMHAIHLMQDGGFRHIPVTERRRPVGLISMRDILSLDMLGAERAIERVAADALA